MMELYHLAHQFEKQFIDKQVTPAIMDAKIRAANSAFEVADPDALHIRFSIGKPIDEEDTLDDWKEELCGTLTELPQECRDKLYKIYEIWHDDYDGVIEVMLYDA